MRTVSSATKDRAAARRRVARARRARWLRTLRSRLHIESPLGVASVYLALALVMAAALFHAQFAPFTLRLSGLLGRTAPQQTAYLDMGEILFTPVDGNSCRKVVFSNRTGWFGPNQQVRCDTGLAPDGEVAVLRDFRPSDRMNSIRQVFTFRAGR